MKKLWMIGVVLMIGICAGVMAQDVERPLVRADYPPTKTWQITTIPLLEISIHVVDTAGVCIYVMDGHQSGGIVAVPKTQINSRFGCQ